MLNQDWSQIELNAHDITTFAPFDTPTEGFKMEIDDGFNPNITEGFHHPEIKFEIKEEYNPESPAYYPNPGSVGSASGFSDYSGS